jgi:hypothetical protein
MNMDYQDIKSYKKPNICENLCPNLTCFEPITAMEAYQSAGWLKGRINAGFSNEVGCGYKKNRPMKDGLTAAVFLHQHYPDQVQRSDSEFYDKIESLSARYLRAPGFAI